MADTTHPITAEAEAGAGVTRRDFLILATGAFAAVGVAGTLWPFIDQMNPDAAALALASDRGRYFVDRARAVGHRGLAGQTGRGPIPHPRRDESRAEVPLDDLKDPVARNANIDSERPRH